MFECVCSPDTKISDHSPDVPECAVCLQTCIHPVKLPCTHIFCFLCVKGAANQSRRCALCRQAIPVEYFNNPTLVGKDVKETKEVDLETETDHYAWFYEGRNGWDEWWCKNIPEYEAWMGGSLLNSLPSSPASRRALAQTLLSRTWWRTSILRDSARFKSRCANVRAWSDRPFQEEVRLWLAGQWRVSALHHG